MRYGYGLIHGYEWWLLVDQIMWQRIILQLNTSGNEHRNILWDKLKVLLVCLTIQIKRGVLWDLRDLLCRFSACASFNSRVTSAIPVFTMTMPEPTRTGCSTGFWVAIQFDMHNNSARCIASFKQGGWEVTSLCIVVSADMHLFFGLISIYFILTWISMCYPTCIN